ncbi:HNH endonuclease [Ensifer sp. ENS04]|uniref:NUMOD4 motif-containing HNH endonuclease n=1 Tax=Ensifer sp. ENS04 TaxID=2769281 RepID=UPI0017861D94|nr:NUMOD4 motif-containing HNH endonuclease [Ensifer sp. ENS04]MBD9544254.1 HNH endonuclease [Ensifer sp. ENS04]
MEVWKPVVGYEGLYEVSDMGQVKSLNYRMTGREQILKPQLSGKGYHSVLLSRNGKQVRRKNHQLEAEAFLGPRPEGKQVCHRNSNKLDNRLSNLRYDTQAGNFADDYSLERHPASRMSNETRLEIIALWDQGDYSKERLARQFGVSATTIAKLVNSTNVSDRIYQQSGLC